MGRRDNFDNGHGNEEHKIQIPKETVEFMQGIANMSRNQAAMERHMETRPVNLNDHLDLKQHLMTAHGMQQWETEFYDEGAHDHIPTLNRRQRDWSGENAPSLDHTDLRNLHHYDHIADKVSYPHSTMGDSHFHH